MEGTNLTPYLVSHNRGEWHRGGFGGFFGGIFRLIFFVRSLFFVIILVGLIVGEWLYCPLFTRSYAIPLADIMDAAEAVTAGNLGVQVQEQGSREFQRLAHSFNRMTAELARTDQQRRNLTADVAHELRTPLHIIQGNLEGILGRGLCTDARAY